MISTQRSVLNSSLLCNAHRLLDQEIELDSNTGSAQLASGTRAPSTGRLLHLHGWQFDLQVGQLNPK